MIIHAGDLVDLEVITQLKAACPNIKAVYGNMDGLEARRAFKEKEIIKIGKYKVGIMHGYGAPNKLVDLMSEAFKKDDVDIVIFGHSHTAINQTQNGVIFFNPGSPTDKVFSTYNSYGIIEINDKIEAKIIKI